jgi:hypothetical protein
MVEKKKKINGRITDKPVENPLANFPPGFL